ncbi:DUF305 domain-containing protein [Blastomonas sp.]|uniref:CopM family metallochaperone n=1 Tax=Blastomonas sp. TaxID=1909299 RepID=UPI003593A3D5
MRIPAILTVPAVLAAALTGCQQAAVTVDAEGTSVPESAESATVPQNEAMRAYAAVNDRMHAGMGKIDPDPDIAFMQGMIPHHQGAIDMAEVVLEHGKDAETRALAKTIIDAQKAEITEMQKWLKARNAAPAEPVDHSAMGH